VTPDDAPPDEAPGRGGAIAGTIALLLGAAIVIAAVVTVEAVRSHSNAPSSPTGRVRVVGPAPSVGAPPGTVPLSARREQSIADSVVRVSGTACEEVQQGSGFVVRRGYVLTNAHVVAGEHVTTVVDHDGIRLPATVVLFDAARDVAVLRLGGRAAAGLPTLPLASPRAPADLAVFGHPGGGALRIAPAHLSASGFIDAIGRDIYGHERPGTRRLLALAARLEPGDSGAPVVNARGDVVAVAFAIDPNGKPIAYALTASDVGTAAHAAAASSPRVATGPCVAL
jgi:S1-C subfamily serine protease